MVIKYHFCLFYANDHYEGSACIKVQLSLGLPDPIQRVHQYTVTDSDNTPQYRFLQ